MRPATGRQPCPGPGRVCPRGSSRRSPLVCPRRRHHGQTPRTRRPPVQAAGARHVLPDAVAVVREDRVPGSLRGLLDMEVRGHSCLPGFPALGGSDHHDRRGGDGEGLAMMCPKQKWQQGAISPLSFEACCHFHKTLIRTYRAAIFMKFSKTWSAIAIADVAAGEGAFLSRVTEPI